MLAGGHGLVAALAASLGVGLAFGVANGGLVSLLGLPPFVVTLGTGFLLGVPVPVYLMGAVLVAGTLFTRSTNVGQEIYAIGANPEAARLSGMPVRRRQLLVYALSGLMSGLAAVVYLARVNAADSGMGEPLLLPVIAAVLIGGTSLFGGVGSLLGTVLGAIILALVNNGMNLLDVKAQWQPLIVGVVLLAAVLVDLVGRGRRERIG
jgi:ribose transport system permease protein